MFFIAFDLITISILHHTNRQHMNVIVRLPSSFSLRYFVGWFISILPLESTEKKKKPTYRAFTKNPVGRRAVWTKSPRAKIDQR